MADQKCFFTVNIMGEDYILLQLLFENSTTRPAIEEIGLGNILLVPYFMRYINLPVYEYPEALWAYIVDIHILIKWLGYRNIDRWTREGLRYSVEFEDYLDSADMSAEQDRVETFKNWPHEFINVNKLAKTGFYFFGPGSDMVKCYFCKIGLWNWVEGDDEVLGHLRLSSRCPLLRRAITNNRPISVNELNNLLPVEHSYDVSGYDKVSRKYQDIVCDMMAHVEKQKMDIYHPNI